MTEVSSTALLALQAPGPRPEEETESSSEKSLSNMEKAEGTGKGKVVEVTSEGKEIGKAVKDESTIADKLEEERKFGVGLCGCCGMRNLSLILIFIHAFGTVLFLVYLSVMQPFLLQTIYDVPVTNLGETTATLGLADELWSIVVLYISGTVSDSMHSRAPVVLFGYTAIGVANFLFPYARTVFPGVLLVRLVYASGGGCIASMLTALIADIHAETGVAIALIVILVSLGSGFGALVGVFVLGNLPNYFCVAGSYTFMGVLSLIFGVFLFWGFHAFRLRSGLKSSTKSDEGSNRLQMCFEGIIMIKDDIRVSLAYFAGFIARGGSILVTSFFSLWISAYYTEHNLCWDSKFYLPNGSLNETAVLSAALSPSGAKCQEALFNEDKLQCRNGYTRASSVGGVAQTLALVGTVLIGPIFARYSFFKNDPVNSILLSSIFGMIAYGAVAGSKDPSSGAVMGIAAIAGIAEISMIIAAQILVVSLMSDTNRGKVAGAFGFFGGLGIMLVTYLGGRLFDIWTFTAPFALMAILSALVFVYALFVKWIRKSRPQQETSGKATKFDMTQS